MEGGQRQWERSGPPSFAWQLRMWGFSLQALVGDKASEGAREQVRVFHAQAAGPRLGWTG